MTIWAVCNRCCLVCRTSSLTLSSFPWLPTSFAMNSCISFTEFVGDRLGCGDLQPRALLKGEAELEKLTGRSCSSCNKIRGIWGRKLAPWFVEVEMEMEMETEMEIPSLFLTFPAPSCLAPSWSQIVLMSMWRS